MAEKVLHVIIKILMYIFIVLLFILLFVRMSGVGRAIFADKPKVKNPQIASETVLVVEQGESLLEISKDLAEQGIVKNPYLFAISLRCMDGYQNIRFGATMTVGEVVMARILERYLVKYPDVKLHMEVANTQELLARLDNGEIDFALVEGFYKKNEYDYLHYSTERYVAVCSPFYPFSKKPEKLLREPGSGTREVLERYLDSQNYGTEDFVRTAEIGSLHAIKELTKAGCGITFLYEVAVREELEKRELKVISLRNFGITHDFTFIWRRGSIYADTYRGLFRQFSGE